MKLAAPTLLLILAMLGAPALAADAGPAAIASLGQINGIALACQQPALASRARNAVQTTAPKTRASGEAFEQATNDAFLAQGKGAACPDVATLAGRLKEAESQLQEAYKTAR
ncbi:MAG: hypothetical protein CVU18_14345 [Betaproteobacteria bacterium HGW-Betaproteobacteria-12]|nr:MAG: hypothetical protein CVU18_14345 [Betaproteobacteria bacterium HGW-Betaproteobacteria-12]